MLSSVKHGICKYQTKLDNVDPDHKSVTHHCSNKANQNSKALFAGPMGF